MEYFIFNDCKISASIQQLRLIVLLEKDRYEPNYLILKQYNLIFVWLLAGDDEDEESCEPSRILKDLDSDSEEED